MVVVRLPDGTEVRLAAGDLVGRAVAAALRLDHPAISEAHAFVSHRGAGLCLRALHGRLTCDGAPVDDVPLVPGATIGLGPDVALVVVSVTADPDDPVATTLGAAAPLRFRVVPEGVEVDGAFWIRGKEGLLLGEVLRAGEPVHWTRIARRIWPRSPTEDPERWRRSARKRWDVTLRRLRDRLREHGVRALPIDHHAGVVAPRPADVLVVDD
ncbi:MAG: hypothetical protein ABMB14_35130 [Myxococcota bacterium]